MRPWINSHPGTPFKSSRNRAAMVLHKQHDCVQWKTKRSKYWDVQYSTAAGRKNIVFGSSNDLPPAISEIPRGKDTIRDASRIPGN